MLKNYFKIAWRNLSRNRAYSFINIGGLSIAIAVCLLITLYVSHEYSYDSFHKNGDRIYSVYAKMKTDGDAGYYNYPLMTFPTGAILQRADPDVESYIRGSASFGNQTFIVRNPAAPDKKFFEQPFSFVDSNYFSFYSFQLKKGDPRQVLSRPFTVVLSERMAEKYFGNTDPVGRFLKYDSAYTFEVTGVAANPPSNSSISYDFLASMSSKLAMPDGKDLLRAQGVGADNTSTYILLKKGADPKRTEAILRTLAAQNTGEKDTTTRYALLPLTAQHLFYEEYDQSNIRYLHIFILAGVLILLLALINYMSLATSRAALRAKEIGVRKVTGADRTNIAAQFYVESALYAGIAFVFGFVLFRLAEPFFFNRIQLVVDTSYIYQPRVLAIFGSILLVIIIFAGSYPSFILSSFNPVAVLYGRLSKQRGGASVRRFFIVLQFAISVGMIIGSLIIEKQIQFFRHTDTGLDRSNVVMIRFNKSIGAHYLAFKEQIRQVTGIEGVSTAIYPMYQGYSLIPMKSPKMEKTGPMGMLNVDEQFIPLLHIRWLIPPKTGSNYIQDNRIIINEEAISRFNLSANPIGETLRLDDRDLRITGVVKNFNYAPLRSKIEPMSLFIEKDSAIGWGTETHGCLFARIGPHVNTASLVEKIEKIYNGYDKKDPFSYEFMDDVFNAGYKAEERLGDLFSLFTGLMILIACLGLFGLVSFSATQRTREIGIRKVLGASIQSIMQLMASDFLFYIGISILIAIPITWYAMNQWLQNFAYKISPGWEIFGLAGLITLLLALITISGIALKVARTNPVKNLRSE